MPLFNFPDPVSIVEAAKTAGLERAAANAACSAAYSFTITLTWRLGDSRVAAWLGAGPALKGAATAMYLSLRELEEKKFLTLTIPQDLLNADNLSKFQTEEKTK
jgi:hypothetical protein